MDTALLLTTYVDKVLQEVTKAPIIIEGEICTEKFQKPR
jgi:hypothetical protein